MFHRLNPRWTRFLLGVLTCLVPFVATAAFAGNTHSEGGAVLEAPGVPETDGTASVQIYWSGDSATRTSVLSGATLAGYWLQDAGFALARPWLVGDQHTALLEYETGAGTTAHAGYYGVATKALTSLDPDEFPAMTVRPIPVPIATAGPGFVDVAWNKAASSGTPSSIAGYNVYRATDGINFAKLNSTALADTTYHDATAVFGTTYQYAVSLAYAGTPVLQSSKLSGNSAPVTPLDATPPDVPAIAALPSFTKGLSNIIAWSSEAASGATAYYAECALDSAFTSLTGNSGWIADTTTTFASLADGKQYFFRVRARDAALNVSNNSAAAKSRQDASAPASHVLELAAYKASSTVSLEWAATDSVSGVSGVQLYFSKDGAVYEMYTGGPFTSSPIAFDASTTGGDGLYTFYTRAADAVANTEEAPEAADATTRIDTQPPAIPAIATLPEFTPGTSRTLNWSSMAASGATAYRIQASQLDNFAVIASESEWRADTTYTFTGLEDSKHYLYRVQARDQAGNDSEFSSLMSSTQDASAPATAVATLPALANTPALKLAWAGSDAASGLANVQLYWSKDGAPAAMLDGGPFTTSPIPFDTATHGGDGHYAFYTLGTDVVSNAEAAPATPDAETTIDTAPPSAPAIASLPTYTAGTTREIAWTASDATSYQAEAATDAEFTNRIADSGWIADATHIFTDLSDAQQYFYRVRSRDAAGNASAYSTLSNSTQDASAPATAAAALPAITNTSAFDIAWEGNDTLSGLTGVQLHWSKDGGAYQTYAGGPFTTSPIHFDAAQAAGDGTYTFYTAGTDAVGNAEAAPAGADATTLIDTAAPGAPSIAGLQNFLPGNTASISWSDESATGAEEYSVEMAADASFASPLASTGWIAGLSHSFDSLGDGQRYFFRVKARDHAHNETGWSGLQNTTMDATAPASACEPLPAQGNDPHLALAWTASDATSGVTGIDLYFSKDGAPYQLAEGSPFTTSPIAFDASTLGDGDFTFYSRAHDAVANIESAPAAADATIHIDTAGPDAPAIAALPNFTAGTSRTLTWSDESAAGATAYLAQASTDAAFATITAETGWIAELSHEFASLSDGQSYYYRVKSRDALGNESSFGPAQHSTQDATAPTSQIAALPTIMPSTTLSLTWSGADAASGLTNADLYFSKDGAPFTLYTGSPFTASPISFDATTTGGDGTYAFYTIAHDTVGNAEAAPASADAQTTIDTAAPEAPTIAALPTYLAGNSATITWSDLGSSIAAYRAQLSTSANFASIAQQSDWQTGLTFTFNSLQDGQSYWFRAQARDAAQNMSGFSAPITVTMDASAPTSQLASLQSLYNTAALQLEWTGTDMTSSIAGADLYYSRSGGAFTLYPGSPFTSSPIAFDAAQAGGDGQYALYIRARDAAGNLENAPASPDAQTRIDTTAPNMPAITALPQYLAGSAILLAWSNQSASGASEYLAEMSTREDFATIASQSNWIASTSFNFNGLDDGTTYFFRVKSRDAALNESAPAATQNTTLDDTPPSSSAAPLAAAMTTLSFPIAWTGTDATSGVAGVDLYYARNGGAYTLYPGGPYAASPINFDASTLGADGSYAFYTRARDRVSNREPAPAGPDAQTTIDTAPVGVPTIASLPTFTAGTSRSISWNGAADNASYLAQCATDPAFTTIAAASSWQPASSFTFTSLNDGQTYWYRVKARNSHGIEGNFSILSSSTQDATEPESQAASLPTLSASQTFSIAWTASDATSGLAGIRLYASRNAGAYAELPGGPFTDSPIAFDAAAFGGDGAYAFYTRATDAVGNAEAAPSTPDAQIIISTATVGSPTLASLPQYVAGTSRTISWTPGSNNASWHVEAATDAAFTNIAAQTDWVATPSYTFTSLDDGQSYFFRVKARNVYGQEGSFSAAQTCTMDASAPASSAAALPALLATPSFSIDWTASDATSGIASVRLYVSRNGGAYSEIAGGPFTSSPIPFDATPMGGDGTYSFYTRATDVVGNIEAAPAAADAGTVIDTTAPTAPLMASEPTTTAGASNTVSWAAVADASEYFAQCAFDADFQNLVASSPWTPATNWTFTNLQSGTTYWFRVRARDAAQNASAYSAAVQSTQAAGQLLTAGWNLISFNVEPTDNSIDHVLASLAGSYNIVRTYDHGSFMTYLPSLPVGMNDLQSMDALHGYWIYMTHADTLFVGGTQISTSTPIDLGTGWNLASYLPRDPMSPGLALASIQGSYTLARAYEPGAGYHTYYPALPTLSDLTAMRSGQGYWLYMTSPDQLVYGSVAKPQEVPAGGTMTLAIASDAASVPTVMDMWSRDFTIDGKPAPAGTVLDAYDSQGRLVGSATVKSDGTLPILHLNGDISVTREDEGATPGETLVLKVRDMDQTYVGEPIAWQASEAQESKLEFVSTESLLPKAYALAQNSPNPFNPSTKIAYEIPARVNGQLINAAHVDLRVFDIRGHVVRTLVATAQAPGRYSITWNGRDDHGQSVSSGVYFYRLHTEHFAQAHKMMLVK